MSLIHALSVADTPAEIIGICADRMPAVLDVDLIGIMVTEGNELVVMVVSDEQSVPQACRSISANRSRDV